MKLLSLFLTLTLSFFSDSYKNHSDITFDQIPYSGDRILLEEKAILTHPIEKIQTHTTHFILNRSEPLPLFSTMHFQNTVYCTLQQGCLLYCDDNSFGEIKLVRYISNSNKPKYLQPLFSRYNT